MATEHDAVSRSARPATVQSLRCMFGELGIRHGDVLLVHSSLSSLGWVCGGAAAVIEALLLALTPDGTRKTRGAGDRAASDRRSDGRTVSAGSHLRAGRQSALLGVGHDKNTSLHLAERRAFGAAQSRMKNGSPMLVDGGGKWVEYDEPVASSDDFPALGQAFEAEAANVARSGAARSMNQRALVDFGTAWLRAHRAA